MMRKRAEAGTDVLHDDTAHSILNHRNDAKKEEVAHSLPATIPTMRRV